MGQGTNTGSSSPASGGGVNSNFMTANGNPLLQNYTQAMPSVAQAYLNSFNRGGPLNVPSYQEMYGSWSNLANRETNRQVAGMNEAFGSQGARYSSDIAGAQGNLRENLGQQMQVSSGQLLQNLRGQQFNEAATLGGLQAGLGEAGMSRMFQDFLRQTSPPPLFGSALGYNPQTPTTIAY